MATVQILERTPIVADRISTKPPAGSPILGLIGIIEILAIHDFSQIFPNFLAPSMFVRIFVSHFRSYFLKF